MENGPNWKIISPKNSKSWGRPLMNGGLKKAGFFWTLDPNLKRVCTLFIWNNCTRPVWWQKYYFFRTLTRLFTRPKESSAREHLREYGDIFNVCSQLLILRKEISVKWWWILICLKWIKWNFNHGSKHECRQFARFSPNLGQLFSKIDWVFSQIFD